MLSLLKMKIPFEVICIDDTFKPESIPTSKWVKKGKKYTVIKIDRMLIQGGALGFQLEEIDLTDCVPYLYFSAARFGIPSSEEGSIELAVKVTDSEMSVA